MLNNFFIIRVPLKIKILFFYYKITRHFVPRNDILIVIPSLARNLIWIFRDCHYLIPFMTIFWLALANKYNIIFPEENNSNNIKIEFWAKN